MQSLYSPEQEWKVIHGNWPQRRSEVVMANAELFVGGRGLGKTEGIISPRISHNVFAMPQSLNGLAVPSFKKFFTQFIPALYRGLRTYGYEEGRDYFIGEQGPKAWKTPHSKVYDWGYSMHWRSGAAYAFISHSEAGSGNGLSFDSLIGEEAKLLNERRWFEDNIPANRGNRQYFGHLSEHHSILLVTDRPTTVAGKWIYRYRDKMDPQQIRYIFQLALHRLKLIDRMRKGGLAESSYLQYSSEVRSVEALLTDLRRDAVYYHEGTTLDNIAVLGFDQVLQLERDLPDPVFRTSVLNEELDYVEGGFYGDFNEDRHTYLPQVTDFTKGKGYTDEDRHRTDCRDDAEIIPDLQLDIALDYGWNINCLVVGQMIGNAIRVDNAFHLLNPAQTSDVVKLFGKHYKLHRTRRVRFHFDHTAKQGYGTSMYNYQQTVIKALREDGWEVIEHYIGQQPSPQKRFEMWGRILRMPRALVTLNNDYCKDVITAMRMCKIRQGTAGLEKDKYVEKHGKLEDQVHAPHYTDALDTLIYGMIKARNTNTSVPVPSMFIS